MENIAQYIDVLIQAPIAVILIVHVYFTHKKDIQFYTAIIDQQNKLIKQQTDSLNEAIKIIKQQERK